LEPQPALSVDGALVNETRNTSVLVDGHSQRIDLRAQGRMSAHIVDHFAHARNQARIIQHGLADADPILTELPGFADESCGMR
jgi:hypothetical protein